MRVPYTSSPSRISVFFQNLYEYLDSGIYCDLTFSIGCAKFPCHRIIVASSSPYFQALLTHQFKENHLDTIELSDVDSSTFSLLLHYIYSGKIELDDHNVHDLLIASDMFQMDEIFQFCCHYLSIRLNEENVIETWKIADELECLSLKSNAEDYILTHFQGLIKHERIQDLPRPLLIKMISNDDLTVDHEQASPRSYSRLVLEQSGSRTIGRTVIRQCSLRVHLQRTSNHDSTAARIGKQKDRPFDSMSFKR